VYWLHRQLQLLLAASTDGATPPTRIKARKQEHFASLQVEALLDALNCLDVVGSMSEPSLSPVAVAIVLEVLQTC
jgi:hypothetical protein